MGPTQIPEALYGKKQFLVIMFLYHRKLLLNREIKKEAPEPLFKKKKY